MDQLKCYKTQGSTFDAYVNKWAKDQNKGNGFLEEKYSKKMSKDKPLIGFENDLKIVDIMDYPTATDVENFNNYDFLGKYVVTYWFKIHQEHVVPLIESCSGIPATVEQNIPLTSGINDNAIAIVGMSCRYPASNNLEEFWDLLFQGQEGICKPPTFRWMREQSSRYFADAASINAGFLKVPVDEFDAAFFGISPKEAITMDPQHRILLELIWEGLEDACINPHTLRGTNGSVFLGSWTNDYSHILQQSSSSQTYRNYMGNSIGAAAGRISFVLGMNGPSIATESGCSSAMAAVHLAIKSLKHGETNLALACGVNLLLNPFKYDDYFTILSPDGRCKTFSEDANGFARAEGAGVLVLKRMSDALRDGDRIWGLIRGSSLCQEGASHSMGTPTIQTESLVMMEALRDANIQPEQVSYVEAHGTGTAVGDPVEVAAIAKAYNSPERKEPLIIGSVKTNIGHTESCSGIAAIMKVILSMHHQVIPPHRNFTKLNPLINLDAVPAIIPFERIPWTKSSSRPRISGVSAFGITGTDVHVIIEEPPEHVNIKPLALGNEIEGQPRILKLSAKTSEALDIMMSRYRNALRESKDNLADIAYSANVGRANFPVRAAVVGNTKAEICNIIDQKSYLKGKVGQMNLGKICFLFTGQGSQYHGMAKGLYESSAVFRIHFDFCQNILKNKYNINVANILWGSDSDAKTEIGKTINSQTSIFCVEYAMLKVWESLGVKADYVLGHSLGEFAAAVCAGILTVEDAIKLVAERSKLIHDLPHGKMLVIKADQFRVENEMNRFANGEENKMLDFAAINSNEQTVVAGDSETVMEFHTFCTKNKLKCMILDASHAFHSKHMDGILESYRLVARTVGKPNAQRCEYISGLHGDLVCAEAVDDEYWVKHTRDKVNFLKAGKAAVELGCSIFIEIGPQPILTTLVMLNNAENLLCVPSLKRNEECWSTLLTSLTKRYINGIEIDWNGLDQYCRRKKVRLPHYPLIGKKYWPDMMKLSGENSLHPLIGSVVPNATSAKLFHGAISLNANEYIRDHEIGGHIILPGACYLEMCMAGGLAAVQGSHDKLVKPSRSITVENLVIAAPFVLEDSKTVQVQTVVEFDRDNDEAGDGDAATVRIYQRMGADVTTPWLTHASAIFHPMADIEGQETSLSPTKFVETISTPGDKETPNRLYDRLVSVGLRFGPVFKSIEKIWKEGSKSLIAKIKVPSEDSQYNKYIFHPVILDAMLQAIIFHWLSNNAPLQLYMPIKIGKFVLMSAPQEWSASSDIYIHVHDYSKSMGELSGTNCTMSLLDSAGNLLAVMSEVEIIDTTPKALNSALEQQKNTMPDLWEEIWEERMEPLQHPANLEICKLPKEFAENVHREKNLSQINKLPKINAILNQLDKLAYYNIFNALLECGWIPKVDEIFQEEELFMKLEIQLEFRKQFGFYLRALEEEGILKNYGSGIWNVIQLPQSSQQIKHVLESPIFSTELVQKFKPALLLSRIGQNLKGILRGSKSALGILFPDETEERNHSFASELYEQAAKLLQRESILREHISSFIQSYKEAAGEQRFVYRVLEVGAGTGATAAPLLEILEESGVEYEYTYTDISPAFFPVAEKKFEKYLDKMIFRRLNIEEDPMSQGFVPSSYDLVTASDVIHATKNLKDALINVRALLKPHGQFDLIELARPVRYITYMFGLLEGFWRFEDFDIPTDSCVVSSNTWSSVLEDCGFSVAGVFHYGQGRHVYIRSSKLPIGITEQDKMNSFETTEKNSKQCWLAFHQNSPTLLQLSETFGQLANNRDVVSITPADHFEKKAWNSISIRPDLEEDFVKLLETIQRGPGQIEGIIYGWAIDDCKMPPDTVLRPYFFLAKAILGMKSQYPRLCLLTRGAVPVAESDTINFYSSTLRGFTKSLANENADLHCKCVDLDPKADRNEIITTFYEIWKPEREVQVACRGASRYVPKLVPRKPSLPNLDLPSCVERFHLVLPQTQSISDLKFESLDPTILKEGELEIQVKAFAPNVRDALDVLKPSHRFRDADVAGFDFSGEVKRIGPNVSKYSVGDKVFGINMTQSTLSSHVTAQQYYVTAIPEKMNFMEASTLPSAFTTSIHCLLNVANISPKDTVLIHTASGGVGLSAIQICKHVGANIIATAGSKRKQNYLKSLGIQHVLNSRNTDYEQQILKITSGRGVDVVLNSLTAPRFKEATLRSCGNGARFVEVSKISTWQPEEVLQIRPDVQYTLVDMQQLGPSEWKCVLGQVGELLGKDIIHGIPYTRFDALRIRMALEYMEKSTRIGKVVCVMPQTIHKNGKSEIQTQIFNPNATYLITGGLGGIGLEVCKWMLERGAKYLLLTGRTPPNMNLQTTIQKWNDEFIANVKFVQLDVSSFDQCKELIQSKIPEMGYPELGGIMHAAGSIRDAYIQNQSWESLSSTFDAKVTGTMNLHELTKANCNLEHFVLFSSMMALFGSPGQSNYTAGNSFQDAFAHYRNSMGLPATSINWGHWGETGLAKEIDVPGFVPISNIQGIAALEYALKSQRPQIAAAALDSIATLQKLFPDIKSYMYDWKPTVSTSMGQASLDGGDLWRRLEAAEDKQGKENVAKDMTRIILGNVLKRHDFDVMEETDNFQDLGVDSLMFVEITNSLQSVFGDRIKINTAMVRDSSSITLMAKTIVRLLDGLEVRDEMPTKDEVEQLLKDDCILPNHILAQAGTHIQNVQEISNVVLTGVTGVLGSYVLAELCKSKQINHITCLIRPKKNQTGMERLYNILEDRDLLSKVDMSKIRCVEGNVALPQLGMKQEQYEKLCNEIDAVFNCAANVQHLQLYNKDYGKNSVRSVNVGGLKNVLEFCCSGKKLKYIFHACSLITVATVDGDGNYSDRWPEVEDYFGVSSFAYPNTKFAGEVLMKEAVINRGIPGKCFRFPFITGDSETGRCVTDMNHLMLRFIFGLKKGIISDGSLPLVMLPVDICAQVSVSMFLNPDVPFDIYNVTNCKADTDKAFASVAKRLGYNVRVVQDSEFTESIREEVTDDASMAALRDCYTSGQDFLWVDNANKALHRWTLEGHKSQEFFMSKKVAKYIPDFYGTGPGSVSSMEYIFNDINFAKKHGLLSKYGL